MITPDEAIALAVTAYRVARAVVGPEVLHAALTRAEADHAERDADLAQRAFVEATRSR
jgi:hypothetical protein